MTVCIESIDYETRGNTTAVRVLAMSRDYRRAFASVYYDERQREQCRFDLASYYESELVAQVADHLEGPDPRALR